MSRKTAKADVIPVRQHNQYACMTTSLVMALRAQGVPEDECSPQQVNKVVGAMPLRGAAWEPLLAAANHYGMRATLTLPSTVRQLKQWTDAGIPVVIAWNPEGREWSHASLVFDVDDDLNVYIADPNIPDPDETVRVVPKAEFYGKWYEKAAQGFLIRRPACAIEREITPDGRQVMAGWTAPINLPSLDSLQLRSLGRGTHPKVLERRVKDIAAYLAKGMSPKRAVVQWFKDNGDRLPEDFPKSPRGTDVQLKDLADSLYKQLTGIAVGLIKQASTDGRQVMAKTAANPSAARVAAKYDRMAVRVATQYVKQAASVRLDRGLREKANAKMRRVGLDGNGRFRKPEEGYSRAVEVMQDHGIELDEVVSSHLFSPRPSGTVKADIALTNEADRFSPVSLSNSILYLQYTEVSDDRFEVVAYLS